MSVKNENTYIFLKNIQNEFTKNEFLKNEITKIREYLCNKCFNKKTEIVLDKNNLQNNTLFFEKIKTDIHKINNDEIKKYFGHNNFFNREFIFHKYKCDLYVSDNNKFLYKM